jgi:hypothetical protein
MRVTIEKNIPDLHDRIKLAVNTAKSHGKSIQIIATACGISDATLYNIIGGKTEKIAINLVRNLEVELGTKFEGLEGLESD